MECVEVIVKMLSGIKSDVGKAYFLKIMIAKDYLKELCNSRGIDLKFEDRDRVILSGRITGSVPEIVADRIFFKCPVIVAESVFGYYTDYTNRKKYLKTIVDYSKGIIPHDMFKIQVPDRLFNDAVDKRNIQSSKDPAALENLIELKILSIIKKSFRGNVSSVKPGEPIRVSSDGIVELDIAVRSPKTKQ